MQELQETWVQSLGWEDPLEEDMVTHSNILAWRNLWTEEQAAGYKELDLTEVTLHHALCDHAFWPLLPESNMGTKQW